MHTHTRAPWRAKLSQNRIHQIRHEKTTTYSEYKNKLKQLPQKHTGERQGGKRKLPCKRASTLRTRERERERETEREREPGRNIGAVREQTVEIAVEPTILPPRMLKRSPSVKGGRPPPRFFSHFYTIEPLLDRTHHDALPLPNLVQTIRGGSKRFHTKISSPVHVWKGLPGLSVGAALPELLELADGSGRSGPR